MNKNKQLRQLAIAILDDENGVSETAFNALQDVCETSCDDIFGAVTACEGRYFLPEDHGFIA